MHGFEEVFAGAVEVVHRLVAFSQAKVRIGVFQVPYRKEFEQRPGYQVVLFALFVHVGHVVVGHGTLRIEQQGVLVGAQGFVPFFLFGEENAEIVPSVGVVRIGVDQTVEKTDGLHVVLSEGIDLGQAGNGVGIRRIGQHGTLEVFGRQAQVAGGGVFLAQQDVQPQAVVVFGIGSQVAFDGLFGLLGVREVEPLRDQIVRIAGAQGSEAVEDLAGAFGIAVVDEGFGAGQRKGGRRAVRVQGHRSGNAGLFVLEVAEIIVDDVLPGRGVEKDRRTLLEHGFKPGDEVGSVFFRIEKHRRKCAIGFAKG